MTLDWQLALFRMWQGPRQANCNAECVTPAPSSLIRNSSLSRQYLWFRSALNHENLIICRCHKPTTNVHISLAFPKDLSDVERHGRLALSWTSSGQTYTRPVTFNTTTLTVRWLELAIQKQHHSQAQIISEKNILCVRFHHILCLSFVRMADSTSFGRAHGPVTIHLDQNTAHVYHINSAVGATGKGILIGMLSAFSSAALVALVFIIVYFFRYTRSGRILLDRIGRPGEFDDEQAFAREEAQALEDMDDLSRTEYLRAKGRLNLVLMMFAKTAQG